MGTKTELTVLHQVYKLQKQLLIEVAQRSQKIRNDTTIDERRQDITELLERVSNAPEPVEYKEQDHTQADGAKTGEHSIQISLFLRIQQTITLISLLSL